jgi:hypothetical protein
MYAPDWFTSTCMQPCFPLREISFQLPCGYLVGCVFGKVKMTLEIVTTLIDREDFMLFIYSNSE